LSRGKKGFLNFDTLSYLKIPHPPSRTCNPTWVTILGSQLPQGADLLVLVFG